MSPTYWPLSEIAEWPGMRPNVANELRNAARATRNNVVSQEAVEQLGVACGNMMGYSMPIAVVWNAGTGPQQIFLCRPTDWEFFKIERAGVLMHDVDTVFVVDKMH